MPLQLTAKYLISHGVDGMIYQYFRRPRTISRSDYHVNSPRNSPPRDLQPGLTGPAAAGGGAVRQRSPPQIPSIPAFRCPGITSSNFLALTILFLAKGDFFFSFGGGQVALLVLFLEVLTSSCNFHLPIFTFIYYKHKPKLNSNLVKNCELKLLPYCSLETACPCLALCSPG